MKKAKAQQIVNEMKNSGELDKLKRKIVQYDCFCHSFDNPGTKSPVIDVVKGKPITIAWLTFYVSLAGLWDVNLVNYTINLVKGVGNLAVNVVFLALSVALNVISWFKIHKIKKLFNKNLNINELCKSLEISKTQFKALVKTKTFLEIYNDEDFQKVYFEFLDNRGTREAAEFELISTGVATALANINASFAKQNEKEALEKSSSASPFEGVNSNELDNALNLAKTASDKWMQVSQNYDEEADKLDREADSLLNQLYNSKIEESSTNSDEV